MKVPLLGKNTACDLEYSDYHDVAAAFGARGFLLDRDNESEEEDVKIQRTLFRKEIEKLLGRLQDSKL